jgi:hypothetical protein
MEGVSMNKTYRLFSVVLAVIMVVSVLSPIHVPINTASANPANFTETVGVRFQEPFTMVYVPGGTFDMGWTSTTGTQPMDSTRVNGVTVSGYYIGQTPVTRNLWNAVMGGNQLAAGTGFNQQGTHPQVSVTWYDVQEFLGRLYVLTGKVYRLATDAEWEYAAKGGPNTAGHTMRFSGSNVYADVASPSRAAVRGRQPNHLGIYDMSGNVEEWVWNTWSGTIAGGVNPTGPGGHLHNQKTRRGGAGEHNHQIAARQIRSIDGADGGLGFRIALSEDMTTVPNGMLKPREIRRPVMDDRNIPNNMRDPRFVTGDSQVWLSSGFGSSASRAFKFWESGEVIMNSGFGRVVGQWYTVNNYALVIVPNGGGTRITFGYVVMADGVMSIISDRGFGGGGGGFAPFGRIERVPDTSTTAADITRPTIPAAEQQTAAQLAAGHALTAMRTNTMIDVSNIPQSARGQDSRLVSTDAEGWWQTGGGGTHQYRKDINDEFRFVVYQPGAAQGNMLANGNWFTVNDVFLRVTHPTNGYTVDYLYTITADGQMFHVSFQAYERGDFRNFRKTPNANVTGHTHIIPRGQAPSFYSGANMNGHSTFMQAPRADTPCPSGCGGTVYACVCPTLCQGCDSHVNNCTCSGNPPVTTTVAATTSVPPVTTIGVTTSVSPVTTTQPPTTTTMTTTTVITTSSPVTTTTASPATTPSVTTQPPITTTIATTASVSPVITTTVGTTATQPPITTTVGTTESPPVTTIPDDPHECCVGGCLYGDVDNNEEITIVDVLEILLFLAGLDGILADGCDIALRHSLILPESRLAGKPAIGDVLEILLYLAGLPNQIDDLIADLIR